MKNRSREIIENLNLRKVDVAEKLGITPVGLNQILNTEKPKLETLEKLANVLNIPVWKLYLTDEEIREVNLLEDKDKNQNSDINGYIEYQGTIYRINSFEDLKKVLKLREE